ncbi:hypothetical protein B0H63DRAFT_446325 [Podospora didyma]|uniref:SUN domain-containing protein n=1 Tax=Podospora didyma TaxID=330526 RepID=A0AAE0NYS2_9PEZI|nr:hypothetical protein B0H63DRAFT_446325 [Podospora didyma]
MNGRDLMTTLKIQPQGGKSPRHILPAGLHLGYLLPLLVNLLPLLVNLLPLLADLLLESLLPLRADHVRADLLLVNLPPMLAHLPLVNLLLLLANLHIMPVVLPHRIYCQVPPPPSLNNLVLVQLLLLLHRVLVGRRMSLVPEGALAVQGDLAVHWALLVYWALVVQALAVQEDLAAQGAMAFSPGLPGFPHVVMIPFVMTPAVLLQAVAEAAVLLFQVVVAAAAVPGFHHRPSVSREMSGRMQIRQTYAHRMERVMAQLALTKAGILHLDQNPATTLAQPRQAGSGVGLDARFDLAYGTSSSGIVGNIPGLDTRHPAFNETTLGPRLGKMFEGIEERLDRVESSLEKTGHGQQPTEDLVNRVWERIKKEKGIVTDATDARGARVGLSADDINALIDKKLVEKRICGGDTVTKEEFHRLIKETEDRLSKGAVNHEELERAIKKRTGPISQKEVSKSLEDLLKSGKISLPSSGGSDVHPNLAEFQNRVNWFALGNGAYPDQELTSPTYHVPKPILATRKWFSSLRNKPEFLPEKFGALSAWEDAGQCWCAGVHGPSGTQVAADLAVQLHSFVVPEALVIEHINPSATIDPQAVPKDMQVWVRIDEYDRRKAAENYMSVHFEGYLKDPLFAKGLVLVGAFIYEYNAANRGAMIYRFSEELKNMDAATDLVLVRAVTNNGGERTCFYRLRLYGSVDEALVAKLERERESHMWA